MVDLSSALSALDDCAGAVAELDASCCDPGRSPDMAMLAKSVGAARQAVMRVDDGPPGLDQAVASLEDIGAQVGRLQVGCCAPNRLPLYARILGNLTAAHGSINQMH